MPSETYYTEEEAKQIVDTMNQQIGWNALACIGAHMMSFGQWYGPGKVTLQIKTRNCAQRNRFVLVTYDTAKDLYESRLSISPRENETWFAKSTRCSLVNLAIL